MTTRPHRPQKSDLIENEDTRQVEVRPLTNLDDRVNNPKDIEVDEAAIANGVVHGGTIETRAEALAERGRGGRQRSSRDISKARK